MRIAIASSLILAAAATARADECASAAADTAACSMVERRAPAALSLGFATDAFDPGGVTFHETHAGFANQIGAFQGSSVAPITGQGVYLDVRFHVTPTWYAGVDLQVGWGPPPLAARFELTGGDTMTWDSALVYTMAAVAGARFPLGRVSLRAELVAGLHGATLSTMSGSPTPIEADAMAALIEPRIAIDAWLSRWVAIEGFAGVNALDGREWQAGVGLGIHFQAFDGRY